MHLKMVTLENNEHDTEATLLKRLANLQITKTIEKCQGALFCTEEQENEVM
jgi:hypothetical protein